MMDFENFVYKKEQWVKEDQINYSWYLINRDRREGVHFHGVLREDSEYFNGNKYHFAAYGIEAHHQKPLYKNHQPVKDCFVTGGDCYCSGSSLQADEQLGHINPNSVEDERYIWQVLHEYYDSWILGGKN